MTEKGVTVREASCRRLRMTEKGVTVREACYHKCDYEDRFYNDDEILELFGEDDGSMVAPLLRRAQTAEAATDRLEEELADQIDSAERRAASYLEIVGELRDQLKAANQKFEDFRARAERIFWR